MPEDYNEPTLGITTYPFEGDTSVVRQVIFGPSSEEFAFLLEVNPLSGEMHATIGNAPATSLLPQYMSNILRELADEFEALSERSEFLEWIYGSENDED